MKRKIKNAFAKEEYNCFGCSPYNPIGLNLQFYEIDDYIESEWKPCTHYEGYPGSIHGGIQAVLMDESAAWTMYIKAKRAGVTAKMNIRYRKQLDSTQKTITLRGKLREVKHNLCFMETQILNEKNEICSEAEVVYFCYSPEQSVNESHFPADFNSFFEE